MFQITNLNEFCALEFSVFFVICFFGTLHRNFTLRLQDLPEYPVLSHPSVHFFSEPAYHHLRLSCLLCSLRLPCPLCPSCLSCPDRLPLPPPLMPESSASPPPPAGVPSRP